MALSTTLAVLAVLISVASGVDLVSGPPSFLRVCTTTQPSSQREWHYFLLVFVQRCPTPSSNRPLPPFVPQVLRGSNSGESLIEGKGVPGGRAARLDLDDADVTSAIQFQYRREHPTRFDDEGTTQRNNEDENEERPREEQEQQDTAPHVEQKQESEDSSSSSSSSPRVPEISLKTHRRTLGRVGTFHQVILAVKTHSIG
jgi:hypothetical protein